MIWMDKIGCLYKVKIFSIKMNKNLRDFIVVVMFRNVVYISYRFCL